MTPTISNKNIPVSSEFVTEFLEQHTSEVLQRRLKPCPRFERQFPVSASLLVLRRQWGAVCIVQGCERGRLPLPIVYVGGPALPPSRRAVLAALGAGAKNACPVLPTLAVPSRRLSSRGTHGRHVPDLPAGARELRSLLRGGLLGLCEPAPVLGPATLYQAARQHPGSGATCRDGRGAGAQARGRGTSPQPTRC